ncbi:hypothetical protein C8Q76DRAFT_673819 [Earliella scabrosa]|nr:hypothetical protein C8Q76DRAFT_673819 [Earliella scabrosa]
MVLPTSLLLLCFLWTPPSIALSINRTIDDELGDSVTGIKPSYSPPDKWTQGAQCPTCHVRPSYVDVPQVFERTWHDTTFRPGGPDREMRVNFTGTAVYLYFLVPKPLPFTTTMMNTTFFLDGELDGEFFHAQDSGEDFEYRVPVYVKEQLENREHSFMLRATGTVMSLVLFDYLVYTAETDTSTTAGANAPTQSQVPEVPSPSSNPAQSQVPKLPSPSSNSAQSQVPDVPPSSNPARVPVGVIVGGTVGGVCVCIAVAALIFFRLRRSQTSVPRAQSILSEEKPEDKFRGYNGRRLDVEGHTTPLVSSTRPMLPFAHSIPPSVRPPSAPAPSINLSDRATDISSTRAVASVPLKTSPQEAVVMERTRVLEDRMHDTRASSHSRSGSGAATASEVLALQTEVAILRAELARLSEHLSHDAMHPSEPPPRYDDVH